MKNTHYTKLTENGFLPKNSHLVMIWLDTEKESLGLTKIDTATLKSVAVCLYNFWLYVNSWGKKTQKMKRSKGSGRKVAALNYENICKMRFLNLLKLEYP